MDMQNQNPVPQRNMFIAIGLSVVIILLWSVFFAPEPPPRQPATPPQPGQLTTADGQPALPVPRGATGVPSVPGASLPDARETVLGQDPRLPINTDRLHGSLNLRGAVLDDLRLAGYYETVAQEREVVLLKPDGTAFSYLTRFGWQTANADLVLPDEDTLWQTDAEVLTVGTPVALSWDNGQGLVFQREIILDENYLFTINDSIQNQTDEPLTAYHFGLIRRLGIPTDLQNFFILHEGPIGMLEDGLNEIDYTDLTDPDEPPLQGSLPQGWAGITDKYWLVALIPQTAADAVEAPFVEFRALERNGRPLFQTYVRNPGQSIPAGETGTATSHVFAGAKEVDLLDGYGETLGIRNFDMAVDFGWFYFLTKPFFHLLTFFQGLISGVFGEFASFGFAILLLTVVVKAAMFPLANKSYVSMNRMKQLQPETEKLRARYKDNPQEMQKALMGMYKREKVNPLSGCVPILLQIPVFFALYKVLFVSIEMRHTPFVGWIDDLSAPDPTTWFNLFGLIPWNPREWLPDFLNLGIWPLIMGITMYLQTRLNPTPPDPMQARITQLLPVFFTFILATFPAGLVIYWAWNNTLSILQQFLIKRRMEARQAAERAAAKAKKSKAKDDDVAEADGDDAEPTTQTVAQADAAPAAPVARNTVVKRSGAKGKGGGKARGGRR